VDAALDFEGRRKVPMAARKLASLVLAAGVALPACSSSDGPSSPGGTGDAGTGGTSRGGSSAGGLTGSATGGATSGVGGAVHAGGAVNAGGGVNSGGAGGAAAGSSSGGAATGGNAGSNAAGGPAGSNGGVSGTGGASGTGTLAIRAADFLNSIGVCTHIGQGIDDPVKTATAMSYAGIKNLRDDGRPAHVKDWITVHQQSGARLSLLTDQNVTSTIDMAKQLNAAGALLAVEGPNEPNNFPVTYENQKSDYNTTFVPVAHFQRDLYAAVKAEPGLKDVPVFHASEAGGSEPDNVGLQFLKIPSGAGTTMPEGTAYADYANTHNYVVGHSAKLVDNACFSAEDPTLNGDWDGLQVEYGTTWHGHFKGYSNADLQTLPRVTTETGWTTSGTGSITEEQQGRLFLNLYLSAYKRGWSYTFVYMLRDDQGQGYWGLFDTAYVPKKSGTYLHNLTTVLADTGSAAPGRLDYTIVSEPVTVHDLLLQKSDGTFELVVWNDRPGGGSNDVTVTFGASVTTAKIYDPTTGTAAIRTVSNATSVTLTLTDHPNVVEIAS
jgi:hypothetical protein